MSSVEGLLKKEIRLPSPPAIAVRIVDLVKREDFSFKQLASVIEADPALVKTALEEPNFLLKVIPHVDGSPRICELVEYRLEEIALRGAWTGPAALSLTPHALAPVAELPILEIVSAIHIRADLNAGEHSATVWTNDLSHGYVEENSAYSS